MPGPHCHFDQQIPERQSLSKASRLLNKPFRSNSDTSIELAISRKIENAVTKLQILERDLIAQVQQYKNQDRISLYGILENLTANIRSVSHLVNVGKRALDRRGSPKKLNIHLLKKQLEDVTNTACYFLQNDEKQHSEIELVFEDTLIEDLQHSSRVISTGHTQYSLVTKKELPSNYEEDDDIESSLKSASILSSASSIADFTEKPDAQKPKTEPQAILSWMSPPSDKITPSKKTTVNTFKEKDVEVPQLRKGDRETVKVTHIASPDCFYVQLLKTAATMNRLSNNIQKHVRSNTVITVPTPEINSLYLVRYISDGQTHWCRGRVVEEIPLQDIYTVYFIDYGNSATVRKQDILMIPPDMKKKQPFAIECKFFDLYPPGGRKEWDPKAVYLMTKIIADNELLMIVTEASPTVLEVDLITTDCDTSVRDALKFLGYGIPYSKSPTDLDKFRKQLKNIEIVKLYNKTEQYKREESIDVLISYVVNPYNIYVNTKLGRRDLDKMHDAMSTFYQENKKGYVYSPKIDMVVAVRYDGEIANCWRRGLIAESMEGRGMVTVRLVDIGNVIVVPWDQIRKLDGRFVAQDCQAKLVKMTHVAPPAGEATDKDTWPATATLFFTKFIESETILKMVISEISSPPEVVFFECFPTVHLCVNAMLVKDGLAESTGDLSNTVEWPQIGYDREKVADESFTITMLKTIQSTNHAETVTKDVDSDDEEVPSNILKKSIEVISAENPGLIYVMFSENKEKLHEFQLELKHYYSKNVLQAIQWEAGYACVVYHRKRYYRGVIIEILNSDKYVVSLRDYAITVEAKGKQLGILDAKFTKIPEFAIRCHLADITPAGGTQKWSAMACEFLQDVLKNNTKLYLARKGQLDKVNKSMPVVIWYTEFLPGGALESSKTILHSINTLLLKNGLALKAAVSKSKKSVEVNGEKCEKEDENKSEDVKESNKEQLTKEDKVEVTGKNEEREKGENEETPSEDNKSEEKPESKKVNFNKSTEEENDSVKSNDPSTETEDHECSSSSSSVAGALKPSTSTKVDWNDLIEMQKQCPEKIIKDWMAPLQFGKKEFTGIPTFVNEDGEIYLHDIELEPLLKSMEEQMLQYFSSRAETDIDINWSPGEMCSVRYFANQKWYRGKVLDVRGSVIKVLMVDYGNEDECSVKNLSKEILYYDLPVFANKVILHDVYPKHKKWLTCDLDVLHVRIVDKQVNVRLTMQEIIGLPTPAIITVDNERMNDFMLSYSNNLSRMNRPQSIKTNASPSAEVTNNALLEQIDSESDRDVIIEDSDTPSEDTAPREDVNFDDIELSYKQLPLPELQQDEKLKIVIINVLTYNRIVFEVPCSKNFEEGKQLFEQMSRDINFFVPEQPLLENFEMGQKCIARYSEDDGWYRAQIVKDVNEKEAYVWFVDFGNFECVNKKDAKQVQDVWLDLPVDHHIATLDDVILADADNFKEVMNDIMSYCETVHMAEIVSTEPLRLKLYKEGTDVLSYQNLLDSGLLKPIGEKEVKRLSNEEEKHWAEIEIDEK